MSDRGNSSSLDGNAVGNHSSSSEKSTGDASQSASKPSPYRQPQVPEQSLLPERQPQQQEDTWQSTLEQQYEKMEDISPQSGESDTAFDAALGALMAAGSSSGGQEEHPFDLADPSAQYKLSAAAEQSDTKLSSQSNYNILESFDWSSAEPRKRRRYSPVHGVAVDTARPHSLPTKSFKTTGLAEDCPPVDYLSPMKQPKIRNIYSTHDSQPTTYLPQLKSSTEANERRPYRHESFPEKLHRLLRESSLSDKHNIISWTPCGKAFEIHSLEEFEKYIIPVYFRHSHIASFRRQLSMYGFRRAVVDNGFSGFAHEMFHRDHPEQCAAIKRKSDHKEKAAPPSASKSPHN